MTFRKHLQQSWPKRQTGSVTFPRLSWRLALIGALCFWTFLSVACHKQGSAKGVTVKTEVSPHPVKVGLVTVTLNLLDHSGKPLDGAHINLEGDMSHAGMAPVFGDTKETAPGRYQGNLQLTMGGDWVVLTHITLANGQTLERQIDLSNVQSD